MGKNKLKKFAEMKGFSCVFEYPFARLDAEGFPLKGMWGEEFFKNSNPIVLELGCGKGEYTVALARLNPDKNFIGIDVKGARIYTGAKEATLDSLPNVAFLRGDIESLDRFFAPGEVSEIWITFPDPQMKKRRHRLTSSRFLSLYRSILKPESVVHLKTDSPFLYEYTSRLVRLNNLPLHGDFSNLYAANDAPAYATGIKTFYEQQWLSRGKTIRLLEFSISNDTLREPDEDDIPRDDYRSLPRGVMQGMPTEVEKYRNS